MKPARASTSQSSSRKTPQEWYNQVEELAWKWYEREIAYNVIRTGVEFTSLVGRFEGKQVVKIPALRDSWEFKRKVEEEFGIKITKYMFSCDFSLFHENIKYKVYLYNR